MPRKIIQPTTDNDVSDSERGRGKQTRMERLSIEPSRGDKDGSDLPIHDNMCCKGCTPHHSMPCKVLYFLILLALDVVDMLSDWLLFADVFLSEQGLVYGPPEAAVTWALLAFSIIGTLTFVFEGVNLWYEVFRNNPWLDSDLVSMVTIWIEDVPQIAINVYMAVCREDPISVFQLTKAAIALLALFIRIIMSFVKYCNKAALREAKEHTTESERHVAYRVFIMLGLLLNAACAIAIFIFTQTQKDSNGKLTYQTPTSLFEDKYNDQRYFQNVSVFVHHPDFDALIPNASTNYHTNWMRFLSINDIRNQADLDLSYNYVYEKRPNEMIMGLYSKTAGKTGQSNGRWTLSECYKMDLATGNVTAQPNTTCQSFTASAVGFYFTFSFTPPATFFRKLIFGDIRVNIKIFNGTCRDYNTFTDTVGQGVDNNLPALHYYRISANVPLSEQKHLLQVKGQSRFYSTNGTELEDVSKVWKTGWWQCDSSGSKAPHLDHSIPTDCSNNVIPVNG